VLDHAKRFALTIILILCGVYTYYALFGTGVEFFPDVEPEFAMVQIKSRGNLSTQEKDFLVKQVEERIQDNLNNEVRIFYTRSGAIPSGMQHNTTEDTIGTITLEFIEWNERRKSTAIIEDVARLTHDIAGIIVDTSTEKAGPRAAKPIELQLSSRLPELLEPSVGVILSAMQDIGGFRNIENTLPVPGLEWSMDINRAKTARFGADIPSIGSFIKMITNGSLLSTYRPVESDEEVDIMVRFPDEYRTIDMLDRLKIETSSGTVPISNFVTRNVQPQVSTIQRADGMRYISIKSDVAPNLLVDQQVKALREWIVARNALDPRINVSFKGDDEEQKEAGTFLRNAFVLALFGMALILLIQFNSFYAMGIILSAVFLSTVGVLLGLILTNKPFGIVMCGVGIISLAGIVVNNNIIFIDTYDKLRLAGIAPRQALVLTGLQRLRPILLTAITTVLGLMPMVTGVNIDFISGDITIGAPSSQWWKQLSVTIAGGLTFATILTLFFTPSLLMLGAEKKAHKTKSI
jgi:multidrug efflux pump